MSKPTHDSTNKLSIPELEQHSAALRTRVDETLAQLGQRLTPRHLGRVAAAKAGVTLLSGGGRVAGTVKRHPQAALAVGIGIVGALFLRRWMRR